MKVAVLGSTPLANAVRAGCAEHFDGDPGEGADVLWVCDSRKYVRPRPGQLVVLSWPAPVGTCRTWENAGYKDVTFAVIPENIREATATQDWASQPYLAVGCRKPDDRLIPLCRPFTNRIFTISPESAEMLKIATNTFLATQIGFGNTLGRVCKTHDANANDVVNALRADPRIGDAYIEPGGPPGPHLQRDVDRWEEML